MSGKPRVYQGVRVRTTVKELLQMHREKVANSKKQKTVYSEHKELCESTGPSRHVDPPPAVSPQGASTCGSRTLPLRTYSFPVSDISCNMPVSTVNDVQQQFEDLLLPGNGYNNNNSSPRGGMDYMPPLSASSPLSWSHGISSDTDYYGHGMAASSSSESLTFCNPLDPNSYSPQDSFSSSSSSSCYDSPSRMESSYILGLEQHRYLHWNPQDCASTCWLGQQESVPMADFPPYYEPTDYPYAGLEEEGYFRKDFPLSSEMCYKVL